MIKHQIDATAATAVFDAIRGRRSASTFGPEAPSRALVEQLIEAACWAPNHHLTEPWRFIVVAGDARAGLGEAVADELLRTATTRPKAAAEAAGVRTKVRRAPVILVVAQVRTATDDVRDLEDYAACCCATQNLLVAAHAAGLATKWSTGTMAHSAAAKRFLGIDAADRIVGFVYLGVPAGEMVAGGRRSPSADATRWLGWA
jgi:nitroreductase